MPGNFKYIKLAAHSLHILTSWYIGGTQVTSTAAEINQLNSVTAGTAAASKALVLGADKNVDTLAIADGGLKLGAGAGTAVSRTAAQINSSMNTVSVSFTETTGAGTYTGAVTIPNGARVEDVYWVNDALWTATTSATLNVGDAGDADGIFAAVDVKAAPGAAAYLSYKRKDTGVGAYAGTKSLFYSAGGTITATVVTVGAAGNAGRSRLIVTYYIPAAGTAATKA